MTDISQYISIDSQISFGKPCNKGTRIAVGGILSWLASGMTNKEITEDYPSIKEEDILVALTFAANGEAFEEAGEDEDSVTRMTEDKALRWLFANPVFRDDFSLSPQNTYVLQRRILAGASHSAWLSCA